MRYSASVYLAALASQVINVSAQTSLGGICSVPNVVKALPLNVAVGLKLNPSSVTAAASNYSVSGAVMQPDASMSFCNVTFTYSHVGKNDSILLNFWMPNPGSFKNRYLSTGGGGYAINSGNGGLAMGVPYGAVTGITDGGLGPGDNLLGTGDLLLANGTINYNELFLFSHSAHHEMALIGKALTENYFMMNGTKLYSYYQGCSEGGREGLSQVQRYSGQFDGSIIGAPAIRLPFQQVQHLYSGVVEQTMNHYPPSCAFQAIVNGTIAACDGLDGLIDGVVARTDLCKLYYDISLLEGTPYSCGAQAGGFEHGSASPAVNGTLSAADIAVAKKSRDGLRDSLGRQAYFTYQPAAYFTDDAPAYNATSGALYAPPSSLGGGWVTEALEEVPLQNLLTLEGITYDVLVEWMKLGMQKYYDTLLTTWPDLSPYHAGGGKVLHYHGESDYSIPTASSVRYYESVRQIMYSNLTMLEGAAAMSDWYRLFLVPGAGHCGLEALQPNGPFPQTNLQVMIDWVEEEVAPATLNATHLAGNLTGQNAQICMWPTRPLWSQNGTMSCVYDPKSYQTWIYDLDAIPLPVY